MKSILVGNGINIEFGGSDYCNSEIIKRVLSNLQTKDYSKVYANKVNNSELNTFFYFIYQELRNVLKGKYDVYCDTQDEKFTLERIKRQYRYSTSMFEVGMEDYFFILRLYHDSFNDNKKMIRATYDGLCFIFLDAIYNNGEIQKIYETIKPSKRESLCNLFSKYDNIFTVNYDCNLEALCSRNIYYLHGDFNTLYDQYDSSTYIGKAYAERGEYNPVTSENSHIYCNAIMGFNGPFKKETMDAFENAELAIEVYKEKARNGFSKEEEESIESLKTSKDENLRLSYNIIQTIIKYPDLKINSYYKKDFEKIIDEICIVGLSPNNDEHIWKIIKNNYNLNKITYYYKSEQDKTSVEKLYPDMNIITIPVEQIW